jgi:uncharacterized DUF497 family protein
VQAFEWDEAKAKANLLKHGISFEEALPVFLDDHVLIEEDRVVDDELRWIAIGVIEGGRVLVVVHTFRLEGVNEFLRIISVRKADTKEQRRYGKDRSKDS